MQNPGSPSLDFLMVSSIVASPKDDVEGSPRGSSWFTEKIQLLCAVLSLALSLSLAVGGWKKVCRVV
jgi:hypothetical protein